MIPCVNLTLNNLLVGGSVGKTLRVTLPDHSWIPPLRPIRCSCDMHSCELRITNAPARNRNAVSQSVAPADVRLGTLCYIPYVSRWRVGARPFSGPAVYSAHCCRPRGCSGAGTPPPLLSRLRRSASRRPDTFSFHCSLGVVKVIWHACCKLASNVRSYGPMRIETDCCKVTQSSEDDCRLGCWAVSSGTRRPTF